MSPQSVLEGWRMCGWRWAGAGSPPCYQPRAQGIGGMGDARVTSPSDENSKRSITRESEARTNSTVVRREIWAAVLGSLAKMKTSW